MQKFAFAAIAAALVASAGTATAQDYHVSYGDLDLSSPTDAATFDRRVARAADRACRTGAPIPDARCRSRFRDEALSQLPTRYREDYARASGRRVLAMVPVFQG